jgi:hypothetical protein
MKNIFYKISYLIVEINCTVPSLSISVHWLSKIIINKGSINTTGYPVPFGLATLVTKVPLNIGN